MKNAVVYLGILVLLLGGCTQMKSYTNNVLPPVFEGGNGVNHWLAELHATRDLSGNELGDVLTSWEQEYDFQSTLNNRLKLALLLAAGDKAVRDQPRASKLLDGIDPDPLGPGEQELISILRQYLDEHQVASGKISQLSKQVREQGQRIEELEQQQRALTTIEQNIQQREKSAGE
jgi:hypothetical protein